MQPKKNDYRNIYFYMYCDGHFIFERYNRKEN